MEKHWEINELLFLLGDAPGKEIFFKFCSET